MSTGILRRDLTRADRMAPLPQAAGALLHPVTLLAIAVLLLNDHVFKHMWPGAWWTGKLSDIAWMVFALPAVAVILALVAPRTQPWSARVFVIAYAGLSLLYLAYNLNEPLHDVIMAAFAVLTKAEHTSPFDPTDAIVVPPALAIAAWVWRSGRKPPQLRRFPAMAVVIVAGLASVATSSDYDGYGVLELAAEEETLVASVCFGRSFPDGYFDSRDVYRSLDGGLTWTFLEERSREGCHSRELRRSLNTARGVIELRPGEGVFLVKDGVATLEVDTSFMDDPVVQALTYEQLLDRGVRAEDIALGLFDLEADPSGKNLVVAVGHNGVLVGMPDGSWQWVNVGPYAATSQSPTARRDLLTKFSNALTVAVAGFLGAAIPYVLKAMFSFKSERKPGAMAGLIIAGVLLAPLVVIWSLELWQLGRWGPTYTSPPIGSIFIYSIFVIPAAIILLIAIRFESLKTTLICAISGVLSGIAVIVPLALWTEATIPSLTLAKIVGLIGLLAISATAFYILRKVRLTDYGHTFKE